MTYELRDNSGSLFKNDKKEKTSQPNARGRAKIGGIEYFVDCWVKEDKNGNRFQSLAFKPIEAKQDRSARRDDSSFDDDFL